MVDQSARHASEEYRRQAGAAPGPHDQRRSAVLGGALTQRPPSVAALVPDQRLGLEPGSDGELGTFGGQPLRPLPVGRVDLFGGLGDRPGEAVEVGAQQQLGEPALGMDHQGWALLEQLTRPSDRVSGALGAVEAEKDRGILP